MSLPKLPRLIFLDTNVVQNLWSFGELVYDNCLSPEAVARLESLGQRITEDMKALATLMQLGRRCGWPLAVSQRTLDELNRITEPNKRRHAMAWGWEIATYFEESLPFDQKSSSYEKHINRQRATQLYQNNELSLLPHDKDRLLLLDAIALGCEVFLTMDYQSIWKFRNQIGELGIVIMRPTEFLSYIEPWIDLLR